MEFSGELIAEVTAFLTLIGAQLKGWSDGRVKDALQKKEVEYLKTELFEVRTEVKENKEKFSSSMSEIYGILEENELPRGRAIEVSQNNLSCSLCKFTYSFSIP